MKKVTETTIGSTGEMAFDMKMIRPHSRYVESELSFLLDAEQYPKNMLNNPDYAKLIMHGAIIPCIYNEQEDIYEAVDELEIFALIGHYGINRFPNIMITYEIISPAEAEKIIDDQLRKFVKAQILNRQCSANEFNLNSCYEHMMAQVGESANDNEKSTTVIEEDTLPTSSSRPAHGKKFLEKEKKKNKPKKAMNFKDESQTHFSFPEVSEEIQNAK